MIYNPAYTYKFQLKIIPDQLDGELLLAPGFSTPPNMDYMGYHSYISDNLPPESPVLYGLHPNAEIGFLTSTSETLFRTVFELQPREGMWDNYVPQWWDEFDDELFTNSVTRHMKIKRMGITEISRRIWLFSAYKIKIF